jgi:hypothetical protein
MEASRARTDGEGVVDDHDVWVSRREDGEERLQHSLPDPIHESRRRFSSGCVRQCVEPRSAQGAVDGVRVQEVVHPVRVLVVGVEGRQGGCGGLAL